jgi:PPOX class probable F420-dependent enzyme
MKKMTREEVFIFLSEHPLTAHLATVREDGRPHVAPIWIGIDGEEILFTTWSDSIKGKHIQRNGYAALSVDDSIPPFNSARLEGPVAVVDDPDELHRWAGIIGARYMGEDRREEYAARNGVAGELLCRMTPTHVSGIFAIAG